VFTRGAGRAKEAEELVPADSPETGLDDFVVSGLVTRLEEHGRDAPPGKRFSHAVPISIELIAVDAGVDLVLDEEDQITPYLDEYIDVVVLTMDYDARPEIHREIMLSKQQVYEPAPVPVQVGVYRLARVIGPRQQPAEKGVLRQLLRGILE